LPRIKGARGSFCAELRQQRDFDSLRSRADFQKKLDEGGTKK
jgi:hypothetical protein